MHYVHSPKTSLRARLLKVVLRLVNFKRILQKQVQSGKFDHTTTPIPAKYAREFAVSTAVVAGRSVYTLAPKSHPSGKHILFLHGGVYVWSIKRTHWDFIAALIRRTGATFVVPDYGLAPTSTVQAGMALMQAVYHKLLTQVPANHLIFMGDSAGGGFALAFAQKLQREGQPQPQQLILLSPWLDITNSNPAMKAAESQDLFIETELSPLIGNAWAGPLDTRDPLVSPLFGEFTGLGTLSIFIGGEDLFIHDVRKLRQLLAQHSLALNYFEYPTMFHVWGLLTFLPEAKKALAQMSALITTDDAQTAS